MKTISDNGVNLIKGFEGYRDKAYRCPAGVWTIGYGHTYTVRQGDTCTEEEAEQWLRNDLRWAEAAANKYLPENVTQNQYDAVVSFIFNLGSGAFANSTLRRLILRGNSTPEEIAASWKQWCKVRVNGTLTFSQGLYNRREREAEVFNNGNYNN